MPIEGQSPIARLALSQFRRSFDDLLRIEAFITPFSHSLLENIFEQIMWFGRTRSDYENFERTVRVAYHHLENGSQTNFEAVAQILYAVIDRIIPALNNSRHAQAEANQVPEDNTDTRIEKYLAYYKVMYEGFLPFICSPVVYAFSIANKIDEQAFNPGNDGKVNLNAISQMNTWLTYTENRLEIGLNNHVRNAYAHNNYRILDDAQVELWDRSWGPETWQLDQLIKLCDELWINALGITCALIIYDINNRRIIENKGWVSPIPIPRLRRQELNALMEAIAKEFGFYLKDMEVSSNKVSITLSTSPKGIDQESELYMGYENHTNLFKIPMWYEEKRVIDQLTVMLHRLIPYFEPQNEVSINVISWEDVSLGSLVTDFNTLIGLQLIDTAPKTVESIRDVFKVDDLGDCVTFVEKEGTPRFVGTAPAMPERPHQESKNQIPNSS